MTELTARRSRPATREDLAAMTAEVASELDRWDSPYLRQLQAQRMADAVTIERLRNELRRERDLAGAAELLARAAGKLTWVEVCLAAAVVASIWFLLFSIGTIVGG